MDKNNNSIRKIDCHWKEERSARNAYVMVNNGKEILAKLTHIFLTGGIWMNLGLEEFYTSHCFRRLLLHLHLQAPTRLRRRHLTPFRWHRYSFLPQRILQGSPNKEVNNCNSHEQLFSKKIVHVSTLTPRH